MRTRRLATCLRKHLHSLRSVKATITLGLFAAALRSGTLRYYSQP